jgi:hypothetical protein
LSDVANGGQILIDDLTFKQIQPSLAALGCVDGKGYNDKQLQRRLRHPVIDMMQCVACGGGCCRWVLDLGCCS